MLHLAEEEFSTRSSFDLKGEILPGGKKGLVIILTSAQYSRGDV